MPDMTCDVLIAGGGVAGLTAAAAFGGAGFDVICVEPVAPVTDQTAGGADHRTTAILQPGRDFMDEIGLWQRFDSDAAPLHVMRIVDAGGAAPEPRKIKDFEASDLSDRPFGWNLPNWLLRRELVAHLQAMPNVRLMTGLSCTGYLGRSTAARVRLSDGQSVTAGLVIAADGRNSALRRAAGIEVSTTRYGQKALAFAVTHPIPHENISTEIHRTGGPFTLVPLPDRDGMPSSAVVWMDDAARQDARATLPDDAFEAEASERSCHLFGPLRLVTPRSLWPIISQRAHDLTAPHLALVAEAAHVVPPIGAQGLNMSLADIADLLRLAKAHPDRLGEAEMLDQYGSARTRDIRLRVAGIDLLNRASQVSQPLLRDARAQALDALYAATPLRRLVMQMGLGTRQLGEAAS